MYFLSVTSALAHSSLAHQGEWNKIKMAEKGMGHRFSSLISPPQGTPAHQLPFIFGFSSGLLFSFLILSYLLWALSSQHKIEPWFPSLALMGFLPYDLSTRPIPGTPARKHRHTEFLSLFPKLLPMKHHLLSLTFTMLQSIPSRLCGVEARGTEWRPGLVLQGLVL